MDTPATSNAVRIEYRFGRFRLLPGEHRLLVDGEAANLGPRAFSLLVLLVERAGQLVTKDEILGRVWPGLVVEENNLQVQVSTLRKILGHEAIVTIPAVGYRFALPLEPQLAGTGAAAAAPMLAEIGSPAVTAGPPTADSASREPTPRRLRYGTSRRAVVGTLLGVLVVAAIALWSLPRFRASAPAPSAPAMSVAILPFVPADGSATAEQIADALTRDLTNALGRTRLVLVVSHNLAGTYKGKAVDARAVGREINVRYLVEGAVRRDGERIEVSAQLIDTGTAGQVWAERLAEPAGLSQSQPALATRLTQMLRAALFEAEKRRVAALPGSTANAMEATLRAYMFWERERDVLKGALDARKLFDEALRIDPNLMQALVGRGHTLADELELSRNADRDRLIQELDEISNRAVAVDSNDPRAWHTRFLALWWQFQWDAALEANARAIRLDPTRARLLSVRAVLMNLMAKPADALPLLDQALALDPLDVGVPMRIRCHAYLLLGRYRDAIAACERALPFEDNELPSQFLVAAYAHEGELGKAAAAKAMVLKRRPGFAIADVRAARMSNVPAYLEMLETHFVAGLRKAGIPEQ
ncbi:MAG TPA: winged helix-turn-helix domain-containing protein [Burkholderiaceae bacterium]|nr:winged helix-turn-helix domain-containing protein [Burkholderiaceae bacterium]